MLVETETETSECELHRAPGSLSRPQHAQEADNDCLAYAIAAPTTVLDSSKKTHHIRSQPALGSGARSTARAFNATGRRQASLTCSPEPRKSNARARSTARAQKGSAHARSTSGRFYGKSGFLSLVWSAPLSWHSHHQFLVTFPCASSYLTPRDMSQCTCYTLRQAAALEACGIVSKRAGSHTQAQNR